ncbi:MAG: VOC family protein [Deltaproteobacteria bacterium]|nr:VOC family protein [Deltaproteobacteria bacterium]
MSTTESLPALVVRMVVDDPAAAIDFYVESLGGEEILRLADDNLGGMIIHAEVKIGQSMITLTQANPDHCNASPAALGGSPVLLSLEVEDADAIGAQMVANGAEVVIPIADRFYGKREGRLRDPFGHLWIITQTIEVLSEEEIRTRMREFFGGPSDD